MEDKRARIQRRINISKENFEFILKERQETGLSVSDIVNKIIQTIIKLKRGEL